jgi:hypothetical protein
MAAADDTDLDTQDEEATPVEQASAQVRTTPFLPTPADTAQADTDQVEAPTPPAARTTPFLPTPEVSARKPFLPTPETPPGWSGPEGAARQQAIQYASAEGGAPRAELVKGLPPPLTAAYQQAQAFAANQQAGAQARDIVNSPPNILSYGMDFGKKVIGNFESLYGLPLLEGPDTDELAINNAVNQMVPEPGPEAPRISPEAAVTGTQLQSTRDALKEDLLRADPNTRAQMLSAYLPYATVDPNTGDLKSVDTAALTDAIERRSDPALQITKAQTRQALQEHARSMLEGDPRLQGTSIGTIISQIAALPAYVTAAQPEIAPLGLPLIFGRIFSDSRATLADQHPDWSDEQLDQGAANSAIIQTVGAEAGGRIIGAGLGPLLRNLRGGYLARAAVQVPATGLAQAGVGAGTQALTNIATGESPGQGIVEAALGQGLVGAIAGGIHAAMPPEVRPPLARPEDVTTGPKGAPIRGPEESTLEQGQAEAEQPPPPPPPPVQPAPVPEAPPAPSEEAPAPEAQVEQPSAVPEAPQPVPETEPQPISEPQVPVTQEDISRRAYEISQERQANGQPGDALGDWVQAQQDLAQATESILPASLSEAEPINSAIANRYTAERMARGELGPIDPSQGKSTEELMQQGLQMSRTQRDGLIDNFMKGRGGDLDQQGAAIRSKEALLSEQNKAASRSAAADPANQQLQAQANDALAAVTAFHNGPVKKFKQVWSDSGRALQEDIPLDYTTLNGLKEAYLKGNNKAVPSELEPKLEQMAQRVTQSADAERVALNNAGQEIAKQTRGKPLPSDDQIRARLMEIMQDLPCPR